MSEKMKHGSLAAADGWRERCKMAEADVDALEAAIEAVTGTQRDRVVDLVTDLGAKVADLEEKARMLGAATAKVDVLLGELAADRDRLSRVAAAWGVVRSTWLAGTLTIDVAESLDRALAGVAPAAEEAPAKAARGERVELGKVTPGTIVETANGDLAVVLHGGDSVVWLDTGKIVPLGSMFTVAIWATLEDVEALGDPDATPQSEGNEVAPPDAWRADIERRLVALETQRPKVEPWRRRSEAEDSVEEVLNGRAGVVATVYPQNGFWHSSARSVGGHRSASFHTKDEAKADVVETLSLWADVSALRSVLTSP